MNHPFHPARLGAAFFLLSSLACGLAAQTTVTVPCNLDNTLYFDVAGAVSNGIGQGLFVGQTSAGRVRRAVMRFDIAANVPANASIVAVSLSLSVTQTTDFQPLPVDVHRITQSWGEGTSSAPFGGGGSGAPSTAGDATWLHRFFPGSFWTNAGGDFVGTASTSFPMPLSGIVTVPANPGTVADVQSWLNNPATNFGWLLKAKTENSFATARRLDSREAPLNGPTLSVTYLLPGQVATWGVGCPSGAGTFDFAFTGSMVGGQTAQLSHTNGPANGIGANIFALELDQPGTELLPGCTVYLPSSGAWIWGNVILFDGAGVGTSPWPVPTQYPGLYFMSQSFALDATYPLGFVLSNAGVAVIQ